jgi:DNA-directed RNA polymerase subunit RPC12/RpoP
MPARTGDRAEAGGTFHCAVCGAKVEVHEGDEIPRCPNGHEVFNRRTNEPAD